MKTQGYISVMMCVVLDRRGSDITVGKWYQVIDNKGTLIDYGMCLVLTDSGMWTLIPIHCFLTPVQYREKQIDELI